MSPQDRLTQQPAEDRQVSLDEWNEIVRERFQVPRGLWRAMKEQESGGNPNAVSPTGVRGQFGVTKATARQYGLDRDDPFQQSVAAARHIRTLYDNARKQYGSDNETWLAAVGKYYAGEGAVSGDTLSDRSVDGLSNPVKHVNKIAEKWRRFEEQDPSTPAVDYGSLNRSYLPKPQPQQPAPPREQTHFDLTGGQQAKPQPQPAQPQQPKPQLARPAGPPRLLPTAAERFTGDWAGTTPTMEGIVNAPSPEVRARKAEYVQNRAGRNLQSGVAESLGSTSVALGRAVNPDVKAIQPKPLREALLPKPGWKGVAETVATAGAPVVPALVDKGLSLAGDAYSGVVGNIPLVGDAARKLGSYFEREGEVTRRAAQEVAEEDPSLAGTFTRAAGAVVPEVGKFVALRRPLGRPGLGPVTTGAALGAQGALADTTGQTSPTQAAAKGALLTQAGVLTNDVGGLKGYAADAALGGIPSGVETYMRTGDLDRAVKEGLSQAAINVAQRGYQKSAERRAQKPATAPTQPDPTQTVVPQTPNAQPAPPTAQTEGGLPPGVRAIQPGEQVGEGERIVHHGGRAYAVDESLFVQDDAALKKTLKQAAAATRPAKAAAPTGPQAVKVRVYGAGETPEQAKGENLIRYEDKATGRAYIVAAPRGMTRPVAVALAQAEIAGRSQPAPTPDTTPQPAAAPDQAQPQTPQPRAQAPSQPAAQEQPPVALPRLGGEGRIPRAEGRAGLRPLEQQEQPAAREATTGQPVAEPPAPSAPQSTLHQKRLADAYAKLGTDDPRVISDILSAANRRHHKGPLPAEDRQAINRAAELADSLTPQERQALVAVLPVRDTYPVRREPDADGNYTQHVQSTPSRELAATDPQAARNLQDVTRFFGDRAKAAKSGEIEPAAPRAKTPAEIIRGATDAQLEGERARLSAALKSRSKETAEAARVLLGKVEGEIARRAAERAAPEFDRQAAPAEKQAVAGVKELENNPQWRKLRDEVLSPEKEPRPLAVRKFRELTGDDALAERLIAEGQRQRSDAPKQVTDGESADRDAARPPAQGGGEAAGQRAPVQAEEVKPAAASQPKSQNFTQFAAERGLPSDYDVLDHSTLSPSGRASKRARGQAQDAQARRAALNQQARAEYEGAIERGEVIDPTGRVTKEGIERERRQETDARAKAELARIESGIRTIENLGPMSHTSGGRLKAQYQRVVDDYNRQKAELLAQHPHLAPAPAEEAKPAPKPAAAKPKAQPKPAAAPDDRQVVKAVTDLEPAAVTGALVSLRDLRAKMGLPKAEFDKAMLDLARRYVVDLQRHNFPASLSDAERANLVQDEFGNHFIGVSLREDGRKLAAEPPPAQPPEPRGGDAPPQPRRVTYDEVKALVESSDVKSYTYETTNALRRRRGQGKVEIAVERDAFDEIRAFLPVDAENFTVSGNVIEFADGRDQVKITLNTPKTQEPNISARQRRREGGSSQMLTDAANALAGKKGAESGIEGGMRTKEDIRPHPDKPGLFTRAALPGEKFLRLGDLPQSGRSRNARDNASEPGVSVYGVVIENGEERLRGVGSMVYFDDRPVYEVTGRVVVDERGRPVTGSDGEPLLLDVEVIGKHRTPLQDYPLEGRDARRGIEAVRREIESEIGSSGPWTWRASDEGNRARITFSKDAPKSKEKLRQAGWAEEDGDFVKDFNDSPAPFRPSARQRRREGGHLTLGAKGAKAAPRKQPLPADFDIEEWTERINRHVKDGGITGKKRARVNAAVSRAVAAHAAGDGAALVKAEKDAGDLISRYRKKTFGEHALDVAGLPKTWQTTLDFGYTFLQNGLALASHPVQAARAYKAGARALGADAHAEILAKQRNHPHRRLARLAGLELGGLARLNDSMTKYSKAGSDLYSSSLAERIPGVGRVVRAFDRSMAASVDTLRLSMFENLVKDLQKQGKTWAKNADEFKQAAAVINHATGYVNFGKTGEKGAAAAGLFIRAPRWTASRFMVGADVAKALFSPKMSHTVRKAVLRDLAVNAMVVSTLSAGLVYGLKQAGIDAQVSFDPDDDDFLKVKTGNERYTLTPGGLQPTLRLAAKVGKNLTEIESFSETELREFVNGSFGDVMKWTRGKLSPVAGAAYDLTPALSKGRTITGDEATLGRVAANLVTPIGPKNLAEAMKDGGYKKPSGYLRAAAEFHGLGAADYAERSQTPAGAPKLLQEFDKQDLKWGGIVKKNGEPQATFDERARRFRNWSEKYGDSLVNHFDYKSAKPEVKKKALDIFERRLQLNSNLKQPNEQSLSAVAVVAAARASLQAKPERDRKYLYSAPPE